MLQRHVIALVGVITVFSTTEIFHVQLHPHQDRSNKSANQVRMEQMKPEIFVNYPVDSHGGHKIAVRDHFPVSLVDAGADQNNVSSERLGMTTYWKVCLKVHSTFQQTARSISTALGAEKSFSSLMCGKPCLVEKILNCGSLDQHPQLQRQSRLGPPLRGCSRSLGGAAMRVFVWGFHPKSHMCRSISMKCHMQVRFPKLHHEVQRNEARRSDHRNF